MGIVGGEDFLQTLGVKDVVDGFHGVPSRRVHVKDDEAVLRHVAKVALQPAQVFVRYLFLVVATSAIIDVLDGHHVSVADVKRIVDRTEIASEHLLGVTLGTKGRIVKVGISLLEVMIADALEESHAVVLDAFHVLRIDVHIVKHYVAERHSHHVARLAQLQGSAENGRHGLVAPAFHVVGIENLRVADGYVMETVRHGVASLEAESVGVPIGYSLTDGDVIARSYAVLLRQTILSRRGDGDKLADRGVGGKLPCAASVRLTELTSVVYHYSGDAFAFLIHDNALQHQRSVSRLTAHQTHKQQ